MYFSYNASSMWFPDLLLYFKLISNAPYGGKFPAIMIFDLLAQTLNMHINSTGISNILISPDLIQKLLSCKHLIWKMPGSKEAPALSAASPHSAHRPEQNNSSD